MKTVNHARANNFYAGLKQSLERRGLAIDDSTINKRDALNRRLLEEYGAIFVAHPSVAVPPVVMFKTARAVDEFQAQLDIAAAEIAGTTVELQAAAMTALLAAREQAKKENLDVTPRGGSEAARRNFEDTMRLWNSRFFPALEYWQERDQLSIEEIEKLQKLPLRRQVSAVLRLESRGIFFSKDFSKSILYSVAAPGASQHLAMLAFDATEFANPAVRQILAEHGWFRTVQHDLPHFTFLGRDEKDLPELGLKQIETDYGEFWIPAIKKDNQKQFLGEAANFAAKINKDGQDEQDKT